MISIRMLIASAATLGALVTSAAAADLPPIYETPLYQSVPEVQPVEIGSGWYLRGDVGYQFKRDFEIESDAFADPAGHTPIDSYRFTGLDLDAGANYQVGAGYQFTDYLRADATFGYWNNDISRVTRGSYDFAASAKAYELMANAYADIGTVVGITPYVGGGIGGVRMDYDVSCSNNGGGCDFVSSYGEKDWRFAYSLMAGLSYDVSKNLKVDLGYRYMNVEGGNLGTVTNAVPSSSLASLNKVKDDGFDSHSIRVGLRYSLW